MASDLMPLSDGQPGDPDAQATVTDYLDYTEYLPSDLNRSLTLINKLDETYMDRVDRVHNLTRVYTGQATVAEGEDTDPQALRSKISYQLDYATIARESAFYEAERVFETVNRHYNRLLGIKTKLLALPKPPSRDPTPAPRASPAIRKTPPTRITLRLDGGRGAASTSRVTEKEKSDRQRQRRVTIPGEVLPPRNAESPPAFTDSEWESNPPSPLPVPTSRVGSSRADQRQEQMKMPKLPKETIERPARPERPPGTGTNAHSAVAGISTANALSLIPKPPEDAKVGSEHAPWMRLTEYEMALLRKRMKKNAVWTPSETMIRRELADAGRGPDNYEKIKAEADEAGEEFLDVDNIATRTPGKPLMPGEISADALGLASTNLSNRGMKLNEAKKQKREQMLLASLQETELAARRLETLGSNFKELFKKSTARSPILAQQATVRSPEHDALSRQKGDAESRRSKKRSHQEMTRHGEAQSANGVLPSPAKRSHKKQKVEDTSPDATGTTTITTTTIVPLADPAPSPRQRPSRRSRSPRASTTRSGAEHGEIKKESGVKETTAGATRSRRISLTLKGPASPLVDTRSARPASRGSRQSTGPPSATLPREHRGRNSTAPTTPKTPSAGPPATVRRSRRPVPGTIIPNEEGNVVVSKGKRAQPPRKAAHVHAMDVGAAAAAAAAAAEEGESKSRRTSLTNRGKPAHGTTPTTTEPAVVVDYIDPNEPRYCICGDVSWGEMIQCDNEACEGEWFHFACVGITEILPRRSEWFCPVCRVDASKRKKKA